MRRARTMTTTSISPKTTMAVTLVVAVVGITVFQTTSMMSVQSAAAANDRCISEVSTSGDFGIGCTDHENKEGIKIAKDALKELKKLGEIEKGSSSQTGFGQYGNSKPTTSK
jgi:hypothetical protein